MINRIITEAYLAATRVNFTLDDGTILPIYSDYADVGVNETFYILLDSINSQGFNSKCQNSENGSIKAKICQQYTAYLDKDQVYRIQEWLMSLQLTHEKAQIIRTKHSYFELSDLQGAVKLFQIIITLNHTVKF